MDGKRVNHGGVERLIAEVAARQHGVITHVQLIELGLTAAAIGGRLRRGVLFRVQRGVYALRYPALTRRGEYMAAVLALGPGTALSHLSAAALLELRPETDRRIHVTAGTPGGRKRRRLIVVHRSPLEDCDVMVRDAIPVTTAARTVLDMADVVSPRELERALDQADYLGLDLGRLAPRRGRRGCGRLTRALATHGAGSTWTRSELEERMLELCRRGDLPTPRVNGRVEALEVDFHWASSRVVVETDGWAAHRGRGAFERDRARDARLVSAGWRVVRITPRRLAAEPDEITAQLRRLLSESDA
jgi:very-short-patch-repair endonuclease